MSCAHDMNRSTSCFLFQTQTYTVQNRPPSDSWASTIESEQNDEKKLALAVLWACPYVNLLNRFFGTTTPMSPLNNPNNFLVLNRNNFYQLFNLSVYFFILFLNNNYNRSIFSPNRMLEVLKQNYMIISANLKHLQCK